MVRIIWTKMGGKIMDSRFVNNEKSDFAVSDALIRIISNNIITPGDKFEINIADVDIHA